MVFGVSRLRRTRGNPHPRLAIEPPPCRQEERTQPLSVLICEPHVFASAVSFLPSPLPRVLLFEYTGDQKEAPLLGWFFFFHVL